MDQSQPLNSDDDRREFLRDALTSQSGFEGLVFEAKSIKSLDTEDGRGNIAKAILALANRNETSRHWYRGCGYVVVGVDDDTSEVEGRGPCDPATLTDWLTPFLGGTSGPTWEPKWVPIDDTHVLFIEVPVSELGAPIYCLHKKFKHYEAGTVFVRYPGQSLRATPQDLDRLTRRAAAADRQVHGITVTYLGGTILICDWSEAEQQRWLTAERQRLLAPLQRKAPANSSIQAARERVSAISQFTAMNQPSETRTTDEYEQEVADYLAACQERLPNVLNQTAPVFEPVRITITNDSPYMWSDFRVSIAFNVGAAVFNGDSRPRSWKRPPLNPADVSWLPTRPIPYGKGFGPALGLRNVQRGMLAPSQYRIPNVLPVEQRARVSEGERGIVIQLPPVTLVPNERRTLHLGVILTARDTTVVNASWTAVTPFARSQEGLLDLPVTPDPITPSTLIAN